MRFADVNYAVYVYDEVGVVRCYWAQVVASGDLDRARACLEFGGADPNWPHIKPQGMGTLTSVPFRPYTTVLLIAICRADLPMVTCLLEHGADPNLPGLDHGLVGGPFDRPDRKLRRPRGRVGPGSLDLADPLNKRYQLCRWSQQHPQLLDARLTAIVQSRDPVSQQDLAQLLHEKDLLRPRVEPWDAALHRWLIEIDGNVNSWGLLWKLLSGSCVLRVASHRRQWYHHRLEPWVHVVPVAADLQDLEARLLWCRSNPARCEAIARAGRQLAEQVVAELGETLVAACRAYSERWLIPR
jgi:hypothetical protein